MFFTYLFILNLLKNYSSPTWESSTRVALLELLGTAPTETL